MSTYAEEFGYRNVRVAVLGATGFIGRWVARALTQLGADLYLAVRDELRAQPALNASGITGRIVRLDLKDHDELRRFLGQTRPSVTFNLACYGVEAGQRDEQESYALNAHLVEALCRCLAECRDRKWTGYDLIHVGSAAEYGALDGCLDEASEPQPTTVYGKSKLAGTRAVTSARSAYGLKAVTARLFTVYGPGEQAGRLLPTLMSAARLQTPLPLTAGQQRRDFTYVEDVAQGLLRIGIAPVTHEAVVNLATGALTSVHRFVEIAAAILNIGADRLHFGALPTRPDEMHHKEVSINRLRALISWQPRTTIDQGVRHTISYLRAHQP